MLTIRHMMAGHDVVAGGPGSGCQGPNCGRYSVKQHDNESYASYRGLRHDGPKYSYHVIDNDRAGKVVGTFSDDYKDEFGRTSKQMAEEHAKTLNDQHDSRMAKTLRDNFNRRGNYR